MNGYCLCTSFPGVQQMGWAGLRRNAVYLIRPDGYVALADTDGSGVAIPSYLGAPKFAATSTERSVHP